MPSKDKCSKSGKDLQKNKTSVAGKDLGKCKKRTIKISKKKREKFKKMAMKMKEKNKPKKRGFYKKTFEKNFFKAMGYESGNRNKGDPFYKEFESYEKRKVGVSNKTSKNAISLMSDWINDAYDLSLDWGWNDMKSQKSMINYGTMLFRKSAPLRKEIWKYHSHKYFEYRMPRNISYQTRHQLKLEFPKQFLKLKSFRDGEY